MYKWKFIFNCLYRFAYALKEMSYAAGELLSEGKRYERKKRKRKND